MLAGIMREAPSNVVKLRAVEAPTAPAPGEVLATLDELIEHVAPADRLPLTLALATRLSELAARILESSPDAGRPDLSAPGPTRLITVDEAAAMAGVTRRWIYDHTRGMRFRRDLSKKRVRIEESGFRRWIEARKC